MTFFRTLAFLVLAGSALAQDGSLLRNGSFDQGTNPNLTLPTPMYWALGHIEGPASEPWLTVLDENGETSVEIKPGPDGPEKHFLYQDVAIEPGHTGPHVLRWKAKGLGIGEAGVYPRQGGEKFLPRFQKFNATSEYQTYEVFFDIPEDVTFLRIMARTSSDEPVVFTGFELVPDPL